MLVLSASKRRLHKFISQCEKIPAIHRTIYWKGFHCHMFFLEWHDGEAHCRASFHTTIYGYPILSIVRYDADGNQLSCSTHRPTIEKLSEFGLVQERTGTRGLAKAFEAEARGPLS